MAQPLGRARFGVKETSLTAEDAEDAEEHLWLQPRSGNHTRLTAEAPAILLGCCSAFLCVLCGSWGGVSRS
jgi:hypothetical protein